MFTELSDINGLFQRLGRCNRKGVKPVNNYNCFVYLNINPRLLNVDGKSGFIDKVIYDISRNILVDYDGEMSEEFKLKLIEENFTYDILRKSNFIQKLKTNYSYIKEATPYEITKDEVVKRFRNIVSYQAIPKVVYDKNYTDISTSMDTFKSDVGFKEKITAMDNVLSYTVSVGKYDIDFRNGVYETIKIGKVEVLVVECEYKKLGFRKKVSKVDDVVDNFL